MNSIEIYKEKPNICYKVGYEYLGHYKCFAGDVLFNQWVFPRTEHPFHVFTSLDHARLFQNYCNTKLNKHFTDQKIYTEVHIHSIYQCWYIGVISKIKFQFDNVVTEVLTVPYLKIDKASF